MHYGLPCSKETLFQTSPNKKNKHVRGEKEIVSYYCPSLSCHWGSLTESERARERESERERERYGRGGHGLEQQVLCIRLCQCRWTEGQSGTLHMPSVTSTTSHTDISLHWVTMLNHQDPEVMHSPGNTSTKCQTNKKIYLLIDEESSIYSHLTGWKHQFSFLHPLSLF